MRWAEREQRQDWKTQGVVGDPVRHRSPIACTSVVVVLPYVSRSRGKGYDRDTYPTNACG